MVISCGIYRKTDARKIPPKASDRVKQNIDEGRGFKIGNIGRKSNTFDFATSNTMWRATLKVLDFTPLSNVDYSGGIIISDWYSSDSSNDEIKISVRFLSNEIRSDGIQVLIYKRNCNTNQTKCSVKKVTTNLNEEIKLAILKQASLIKTLKVKKYDEENSDYKIQDNRE